MTMLRRVNLIVPWFRLGTCFFFISCLSSAADAPAPAASSVPLSLETVLKATLLNNAQIQEAGQDIEIARAQLQQARAAMWPKASAIVLGAPIFEERGNALGSTQNWSKWGPLVKGGVEIVQPLYTFGMISSYKKAAENQIIARTELTEVKRTEVIVQAKEFYFGFQMASEFDSLLGDLVSFLEDAVAKAEDGLKEGKKGVAKPHDVYKLKSALEDLRQKHLLAKQSRLTAAQAIGWVSGINIATSIDTPSLTPSPFKKKTLAEYIKIAQDKRPEFKALASGQEARLAFRDAKRAQSYPIIFVGAFGSTAWSPVRDKQQSAYALDQFNRTEGGAGIGLKFDLEFARHTAEAAEQNAEAMKLKAKEMYAAPGIELQVKKAYWELEQAMEGLEVAKRRKDIGKKWFVSSAMGWSVGLTAAKDLLEALEGDGLAKKNYIETVYSYNMALSHLTQAVGDEVADLKYR